MTTSLRFGADVRLSGGKDFRHVFDHGLKTVGKSLIVWYHRDNVTRSPRLGLSVSSKVGNAVRRARLKRLIRESFRLNRGRLPLGLDIVAYPRPQCQWIELRQAETELLDLLKRTGHLLA